MLSGPLPVVPKPGSGNVAPSTVTEVFGFQPAPDSRASSIESPDPSPLALPDWPDAVEIIVLSNGSPAPRAALKLAYAVGQESCDAVNAPGGSASGESLPPES